MRYLGFCLCVYLTTFWALCVGEEKRAPSGFTGVRGKKSLQEVEEQGTGENSAADDSQYFDKRAPSGFTGLRGKKPFDRWDSPGLDDVYKRVPSGFTGLRGKKEMDYELEFDKRVPNGFLGMRGKKLYDLLNDELKYDKRPSPSGFWGMRGKRDYDVLYDGIKRVPDNRFLDVEDKRQPSRNTFFGMRGKKYPYDLRGKFVGVRGKKSVDFGTPEYFNSNDLPGYDNDLDLNKLMYVLSQNERNYGDDYNFKQE